MILLIVQDKMLNDKQNQDWEEEQCHSHGIAKVIHKTPHHNEV